MELSWSKIYSQLVGNDSDNKDDIQKDSLICRTSKVLNLLVLFFFFFASLSAQENYTVVVKCPTIANQCGSFIRTATVTYKGSKGSNVSSTAASNWRDTYTYNATASGALGYSLATSTLVYAGLSESFKTANAGTYSTTRRSANVTKTYSTIVGFANFNIANIHSNLTVYNAAVSYPAAGKKVLTAVGMDRIPSAANSAEFTNLLFYPRSTGTSVYTDTKRPYYNCSTGASTIISHTLINAYSSNTAYTTSVYYYSSLLTYLSVPEYPSGTHIVTNSTYITRYHDGLANAYRLSTSKSDYAYYATTAYPIAFFDIENTRQTTTRFGIAFIPGAQGIYSNSLYAWYDYSASTNTAVLSAATSAMNLLITYAAPWSCVLAPSVRTSASSACVGDGIITLSAMQNEASIYVPIVATKTWQWYSGTNGSNGTYATMGGTFTATALPSLTVVAPANTGSVWYKYLQTIKITTNATCAPLGATSKSYSLTNCRPASVLVKQCCTPLGGTLTFNGTQTGDRSVTLSWGGITNTNGIRYYVISYGTGPTYKQIEVEASRNSIEIGNLTNGRTYHFEIQAIGKTGSPSYCNSNTINVNLSPECNE